jgi:hypothetical protein
MNSTHLLVLPNAFNVQPDSLVLLYLQRQLHVRQVNMLSQDKKFALNAKRDSNVPIQTKLQWLVLQHSRVSIQGQVKLTVPSVLQGNIARQLQLYP